MKDIQLRLILGLLFIYFELSLGANILMVTMGSTKSHKILFTHLGANLVKRNHSVKLISAVESPEQIELDDFVSKKMKENIEYFSNIDFAGKRFMGEIPISYDEAITYELKACNGLLEDEEMILFLKQKQQFDLIIADSALPHCPMGLVHYFKAPFVFINTVPSNVYSINIAGTPTPYSVTPAFILELTDEMNFIERLINVACSALTHFSNYIIIRQKIQGLLDEYFNEKLPSIDEMMANVSVILQNGNHLVTSPRLYLPNVVEIGCIHCRPSKPLDQDIENFIGSGEGGFIYVSMGSSVRTDVMDDSLRKIFVEALSRLPYKVLWKWDAGKMKDLPSNVMLKKWVSQQDVLGHEKIIAFVSQTGILSMMETIYHGVPIVTIPVFGDQNANSAKIVKDGYGIKLELDGLNSNAIYEALIEIKNNPKYKESVKARQKIMKDGMHSPLELATYWVEYAIRHKGPQHFKSPASSLGFIQYYLIDIVVLYLFLFISLFIGVKNIIAIFKKHKRSLEDSRKHYKYE